MLVYWSVNTYLFAHFHLVQPPSRKHTTKPTFFKPARVCLVQNGGRARSKQRLSVFSSTLGSPNTLGNGGEREMTGQIGSPS